ncbi:DUF300-domain-containing protein [Xylariaceae sp. FL0594]|nr:DUF300-domain-containing protein [Xylariaceae sp. FL0594]
MGLPICNSTLEDMDISEDKLVGDLTFHQLALIIAGGATIIAYLVSFYLMWRHAMNYTKPREQKHIIRILLMVPIYATSAFLSLWFHKHAVYYQVISEAYEAFAIASFFALVCHLIAPDLHEQKQFFRQLHPIHPWILPVNWFAKCCGGERGIWRTPKSGLTWFNIIWVGVYQYSFMRVAMTIVAVVTQYFHRYCESSNSPVFAHVWVIAIEALAVTVAMYCILQCYTQFKTPLAEHKLGLKVLAIKLVIFLSFWQTIAISLATSERVHLISANATLAYPDLKIGIPSLLLCIEMALFAVLHLWSFPYAQYRPGAKTTFYPSPDPSSDIPLKENELGPKMGGPLGLLAFLDAVNLWDVVKAFGRGIRWLFVGAKRRHEDVSYQLKADTSYTRPAKGKSTDHLPIATQFRRSTFGAEGVSGPEESAGLIANAQPEPGSGQTRPSKPYQDTDPRPGSRHGNSGSSAPPQPTTYTPYRPYDDDREGDLGSATTRYDASEAAEPYEVHGISTGGTATIATPQNARTSTQTKVGNALWGHPGQGRSRQ